MLILRAVTDSHKSIHFNKYHAINYDGTVHVHVCAYLHVYLYTTVMALNELNNYFCCNKVSVSKLQQLLVKHCYTTCTKPTVELKIVIQQIHLENADLANPTFIYEKVILLLNCMCSLLRGRRKRSGQSGHGNQIIAEHLTQD